MVLPRVMCNGANDRRLVINLQDSFVPTLGRFLQDSVDGTPLDSPVPQRLSPKLGILRALPNT